MMRLAGRIRGVGNNRSGATAVEFAMVLPAFMLLIVGGFSTASLLYVASSMKYAVEVGARCAAVNTTVCSDSTSTVSYVKSHFSASGAATPTFTSTTAACGHNVAGNVTYVIDTGLGKINVPVSAAACFP